MAATSAGALKAHIESLGLGLPAYRDRAPQDAALPYAVIREAVTATVRRHGDFGDINASRAVTEEVQIDLWQQARDPESNAVTESYTLPSAVFRNLHGARLPAAPTHVHGVKVLGMTRFPDPDARLVRHLITVQLDRAL